VTGNRFPRSSSSVDKARREKKSEKSKNGEEVNDANDGNPKKKHGDHNHGEANINGTRQHTPSNVPSPRYPALASTVPGRKSRERVPGTLPSVFPRPDVRRRRSAWIEAAIVRSDNTEIRISTASTHVSSYGVPIATPNMLSVFHTASKPGKL
jgi:hypothetical protein